MSFPLRTSISGLCINMDMGMDMEGGMRRSEGLKLIRVQLH